MTEQEGGYYSSPEEFKEEIRAVRERTGRLKLRVLDVGSNFGLALKDMKDLDPNIETFNMTIDEHPSLFGDHIVRHPAEMVPLEFEETMDLIDSQMAFRYFLYPDIALRNVIKSLSVGGVARIAFIFGGTVNCFPDPNSRVNLDDDERKNRQRVLWTQIKTFVDEGYLDITGSSNGIHKNISTPDESGGGFIRIVKIKSTKGVKF